MSKQATYRGQPLPNALSGDETPEQAAEKLVGDGQSPALRVTRAIVTRAIREDRLAMGRTTKAIVELEATRTAIDTITVTCSDDVWIARLDEDRWDRGPTRGEAIGNLVHDYASELGHYVVIKDGEETP